MLDFLKTPIFHFVLDSSSMLKLSWWVQGDKMCQHLEICLLVVASWKADAKMSLDTQRSYWKYLWRVKGERDPEKARKAFRPQCRSDTCEGERKGHGWGRESFRLQCSSRNVSAKPLASYGAKVTSLKMSTSCRDGTALVLSPTLIP